jgi:hypothetical protein
MRDSCTADQGSEVRSAQFGVGGASGSPTSSVSFDANRRAASPELKASIKALAVFLEANEKELGLRKRVRKLRDRASFVLAVEALVCNLAALSLLGREKLLAVPRSNGMMWSKSRYRPPVYGQHFLDALDLMAHPKIGLIESIERGFKFTGGTARRSTIRPTAAFALHIPRNLRWDAFTQAHDYEVLVLKGLKDPTTGEAEALEYRDTALTRRRRKEVQQINAYLRHAPLICSGQGNTTREGHTVDPMRRTVRRIFNNGSWHQGGRLYDGFWETMRREDRFKHLRIATGAHPEGEPVANVDYGQLFLVLAYREVNLTPPGGDLYDITGDGSYREGWKRLCNAVLLANAPVRNWPRDLSSAFPKGTKLQDAIAAIVKRHAPIAHLFGTGVGFKLMLLESEMLIEVLLRLYSQKVTALPLHDSVLVAASEVVLAEEAMEAAFSKWSGGARAKLKTTFA